MHRLRDEAGDDPVAVRGIELLRGTPPAARSPESKRRVWRSIERSRVTEARRLPLSKLRMAAVALAVLCVAGSAGAVIAARHWIAPALRGISSRAVDALSHGHHSPAPRTGAPRHAPSDAPDPSVSVPEAQAELPAAPSGTTAAAPRAPVRRVISRRRISSSIASAIVASTPSPGVASNRDSEPFAAPPAAAAATVRERIEVLDAMVALRRDRDPVTAGRMLDAYLTAHPAGALREEALVLAIEAAAARGDVTLARRLARQYQSVYPTGRFRQFAQATAGS